MVKAGQGTLLLVAAIALGLPQGVRADDNIYKDKNLTLIVGNAPGGGNDNYARLVARHIGAFVPGSPSVVVQNMPGAGGLRAASHMYNVAPKDGTTFALIQRANLTGPLLDTSGRKMPLDMTKFNWLGSINSDTGFIIVWHTTPHREFADLAKHELIVGSANPTSETIPYFLNNVFGTKIKVVSGYKSGTEILLAMEKGEVQARILGSIAGPWPIVEPLMKENKVRFLATLSLRRSQLAPSIPALIELARTDEHKQMLDLLLSAQSWGRPFLLPPETPKERVALLRSALYRMTEAKPFLDDARKGKLDIDLMKGEEIDEIITRLYKLPPALIAATKQAVTPH